MPAFRFFAVALAASLPALLPGTASAELIVTPGSVPGAPITTPATDGAPAVTGPSLTQALRAVRDRVRGGRRRLLAGGFEDGALTLWDAETGGRLDRVRSA
jgi:hypothetical protein